MRIVNIDPTGGTREIADTGQTVAVGEEVDVENEDLAHRLLEQTDVWARPTTKVAKAIEKGKVTTDG